MIDNGDDDDDDYNDDNNENDDNEDAAADEVSCVHSVIMRMMMMMMTVNDELMVVVIVVSFVLVFGLRPGPPKIAISNPRSFTVSTFGLKYSKLFCEAVWRGSGTVLGSPGNAPGTLRKGFRRHSGEIFLRNSIAKTWAKIFENCA